MRALFYVTKKYKINQNVDKLLMRYLLFDSL